MTFKFYERPVWLGDNPYLNDTPVLGEVAEEQSTDPAKTGAHYQYEYKGVKIDPYVILSVYRIYSPALQHAIKKLLRLGRDGEASVSQEVRESISSLKRFKQLGGIHDVCAKEFSGFYQGIQIDIPRILRIYKVNDYCIQKALELLLVLKRGVDLNLEAVVDDAIYYLERYLEMEKEDAE